MRANVILQYIVFCNVELMQLCNQFSILRGCLEMYGQLCESEVKEDEDEDTAIFPSAYQYGLHPTNTGSNE